MWDSLPSGGQICQIGPKRTENCRSDRQNSPEEVIAPGTSGPLKWGMTRRWSKRGCLNTEPEYLPCLLSSKQKCSLNLRNMINIDEREEGRGRVIGAKLNKELIL